MRGNVDHNSCQEFIIFKHLQKPLKPRNLKTQMLSNSTTSNLENVFHFAHKSPATLLQPLDAELKALWRARQVRSSPQAGD